MTDGDKILAQQIKNGNSEAERSLISRFGSRIARRVRYEIGAQNDDWKDVVNEVLLAVLENLRAGRFDPERGAALGSYIYGVTNNKIRDYFKFKKREQRKQPLENHPDLGAVENFDLEEQELRAHVRILLKNLKEKYQRVLYLRYFKELSIPEIAEDIQLPPRRVSERLNYALKLLRKEMQRAKYFSIFEELVLIIL